MELPEDFLNRMKVQLGSGYAAFAESYSRPAERGIRVNTLKISSEEFAKISPFVLEPIPWERNGFYVTEEKLGRNPLYSAGLYYPQEPSAMAAVPELNICGGERILDLCAAPGGKSTQIASYMRGEGLLVSNETDRERSKILRRNIERSGITNCIVLNAAPERLAAAFESRFDKILVDAPCSGEGMFKKEINAVPEWSAENVNKCAARQKDILRSADKMLAGGGILVYSTCTFAPAEDEEQIAAFLREHVGYRLIKEQKLYPHEVRGEGHYVAVLQKKDGERLEWSVGGHCRGSLLRVYREWEKENLKVTLGGLYTADGKVFISPDGAPDEEYLRRKGIAAVSGCNLVGEFSPDGKRFIPSHTLAMRLKASDACCLGTDADGAAAYLRGVALPCGDGVKGWKLVTYLGYPLGWCKCVNGTAKNHYPKGLRINR